ncbi:MFS transporter [Paenibacillus silviterrae]|uniref:MFS transporter n=1 Tax=Paenibacillus silviterrae TaxID=3242194 RepID=UPI0025428ABF|nr:MFS transporter [Paenibacillus chinjuensis]
MKDRNALFSSFTVLRTFSFSCYMTMAVIVSYFPLYFQSRGLSTLQIGAIYSIGPLIGIGSNLFWGFLSDKYRTVKKILILVLIGQWILAFFVFQSDAYTLLLVLMSVFFFFQSPVTSLTDSLTLLSIRNTGKSFASFRVWGSIGFAFAALVFGQLMKGMGTDLIVYLCLFTIGLSFLLSLGLKDAGEGSRNKPDFSNLLPIISSRPFLAFMLIVLTVSVAHRMNDNFLALFLQRLGADPSLVGLSWMSSALAEIPIFFLLSRFGHRFKELPLLILCSLVYTVRFLLMSRVTDPSLVIFIQLLHSLSFGIFLFTVIRYIQRLVPDQFRASGQALFAVTWSGLAGLLSGLVGGWVFNTWGPHTVYSVSSVLAFIAMIGFIVLHMVLKDQEPAEEASSS